jgi:hypothetical protein
MAYLKPVEEVGDCYEEEKCVTHGYSLDEPRHVLHMQDISGACVEIGVNDRCQ